MRKPPADECRFRSTCHDVTSGFRWCLQGDNVADDNVTTITIITITTLITIITITTIMTIIITITTLDFILTGELNIILLKIKTQILAYKPT